MPWLHAGNLVFEKRAVKYGREVVVLTQFIIPQEGATGDHISETAYEKKIFDLRQGLLESTATNPETFSSSGKVPIIPHAGPLSIYIALADANLRSNESALR